MSIQRIQVERVCSSRLGAWTSHPLPLPLPMALLLPLLLLLLSPSPATFVAASATGSMDPFNSTLSSSTPSDPAAALPIGSGAAVGILCAAVVLVCCCLFICARRQIGAQKSKHSGSGAGVGAMGTAAAARSARMRAKLDAMRRGWRKSEIDDSPGSLTGVVLAGGARESVHATAVSSIAQTQAIRVLSGASMGGLGACRFSAFASDDFVDEPWATSEVIESLRRSGNILDVVLTAQMSMALSALSGLVPLAITVALPFHELILEQLEITDWYGRIWSVEFELCITISGAALAVHLLAYLAARAVFNYDRAPSIQKQTQELKAAARIEEQKRIQAAAATSAGASAAVASTTQHSPLTASPGAVTRGGSLAAGGGSSMSAVTQAARNGLFMRQPTFVSPAAAFASNVKALPPGVFSPSSPTAAGPAPIVAQGSDPSLLPLIALCVASLGSYLLLGFAGFIAMDESIGRQYGLTSTPRKLWPPSAGRGPFITFLVCVIVGTTAMVPIAFSLKLLALFKPRHVHPNLMH